MPSPRTRRTERFVLLFLLFISLFIVTACSWALWRSWQNRLQDVSVQARNQSLSLSRQAQDTFLQVNIALDEIARQTDQVFSHPEAYSGERGILADSLFPCLSWLACLCMIKRVTGSPALATSTTCR